MAPTIDEKESKSFPKEKECIKNSSDNCSSSPTAVAATQEDDDDDKNNKATSGTTASDNHRITSSITSNELNTDENDVEQQHQHQECRGDVPENQSQQQAHYTTPTGRMPRQWLVDRCDGTSKYNPNRRPPCKLCYAPIPIKWFPDYLEQNCCCEAVGKIGCLDAENTRARKGLFVTAFIINVIGLLCLIVASFAIANDSFRILWNVSFTNIWLQLIEGPENYGSTPTFVGLGLRAAAVESLFAQPQETGIIGFDQFCDLLVADRIQAITKTMQLFVSSYQEDYDCDSCQNISQRIVPSLFLSMLSYIPNFTTDILRIYSNYDVNCQKFVGSVFSWISLGTAIYTWVNYRKGCFDSLNTEPFGLTEDLEKVELNDPDVFLVVRFQWSAAIGQICLAVATFLKIVDIVINCIMPTPTITRDHMEQVEYEWKYGNVEEDESEEDNINTEEVVQQPSACGNGCNNNNKTKEKEQQQDLSPQSFEGAGTVPETPETTTTVETNDK